MGRKTARTDGTGATIRYAYDARNNLIATTQPLGEIKYATFNAQGKQIGAEDANGKVSTWSYDYFGELQGHTDIGGATYWFNYDNARQLIGQGNSRGQNQTVRYDAAGQMVQITDNALNQVTNYAYNAAGKHVLEQTIQGGVTYQNQQLAYDTLGRLAYVGAINGVSTTTTYDKVGNKLRMHVTYGAGSTQDLWSAYDAMNRQILVDGAANGNAGDLANITSTQGHILSYDRNGNRISDTTWGTQVTPEYQVLTSLDESGNVIDTTTFTSYTARTGINTQWYGYDAMNRLSTVATGAYAQVQVGTQQVQTGTDESGTPVYATVPIFTQQAMGRSQAIVLDTRLYDGASRELQSGPSGSLPAAYISALVGSNTNLSGATSTVSRYDNDGRLLSQHVVNEADSTGNYDMAYTGYDAAGNVTTEQMTQGDITTNYTYTQALYDGYKESSVGGVKTNTSSGNQTSGTTTDSYDVNGMLVGVTDSANGADNRSFINDVNGHALQKTQQSNVFKQLVVNGDVVGNYGVGVNPDNPTDSSGNPNYAGIYNFDLAYQPVTNSYPAAATGQYPVQSGDTLQSIALAAYGDSSLWYQIAQANGLSGNADLKVGEVLTIPTQVGATHNTASTYAPYNASRVVGSTTPNLPTPAGVAVSSDDGGGGGCGMLGTIIMIVVSVVATYYLGPVLGNIVTQIVGNVIGTQDGFSWKQVAIAVLEVYVTGGGGDGGATDAGATAADGAEIAADGTATAADGAATTASAASSATPSWAAAGARAALSNAVTQGISVAVGLQSSFSWTSVAASAVGAGVGSAVSSGVSSTFGSDTAGKFATAAASSFAGGLATSVMNGGRVSVVQVAADAFGNALGNSLATANNTSTSGQQGAPLTFAQDMANRRDSGYWTPGSGNNADAPIVQSDSSGTGSYWDTHPMMYASNDVGDPSQSRVITDLGAGSSNSQPIGNLLDSSSQMIRSGQLDDLWPSDMTSGGVLSGVRASTSPTDTSSSANDLNTWQRIGTYDGKPLLQAPGITVSGSDTGVENIDAENGSRGSVRALDPFDSFLTFTSTGRFLNGFADGVGHAATGLVQTGKQVVLTAGDAVSSGMSLLDNAMGGNLSYTPHSALGMSIQHQGIGPTALSVVGGVVQGTVGTLLQPINALYRQNAQMFGESLPGAVMTAAPLVRAGMLAEIGGANRAGGITAAERSASFQGVAPYEGVDRMRNIGLQDGSRVAHVTFRGDGLPVSEYFTTESAINRSRLPDGTIDANHLSQGLQIYAGKDPITGLQRSDFKPMVQFFEVAEPIPFGQAAFGRTLANPQLNPGEYRPLPQIFINKEFHSSLRPVDLQRTTNTGTPTYPF